MDAVNTLKGLLLKFGFTWNTLLRLFYSLCGWLVVGAIPFMDSPAGLTPIGVLRHAFDWLGAPSSFTSVMERWCNSHIDFLGVLGLIVIVVSIAAAAKVARSGSTSIEVPAFLFGLALWLQAGVSAWMCGAAVIIAWFFTAFMLGFFVELREWFKYHRIVIPFDDGMIFDFFAWPGTLFFALCYPLLTLVRLLFDGMPSRGV